MLLLCIGLWIGRDHATLIRRGATVEGRIVGFRQKTWRSSSGSRLGTTANMPLVEFPFAGRAIRLEDWLAGRTEENKNSLVQVRFLPDHPSMAMIDRPLWNWLPWGPIAAVGALLLLGACRRIWQLRRQPAV